jgi:hypothetical protein
MSARDELVDAGKACVDPLCRAAERDIEYSDAITPLFHCNQCGRSWLADFAARFQEVA